MNRAWILNRQISLFPPGFLNFFSNLPSSFGSQIGTKYDTLLKNEIFLKYRELSTPPLERRDTIPVGIPEGHGVRGIPEQWFVKVPVEIRGGRSTLPNMERNGRFRGDHDMPEGVVGAAVV